jgi:predicted nuclease with TOPRIM domain
MTHNPQVLETSAQPFYSHLNLLERNEYLQEELKVCRNQIEALEAEVARLTEELRIAQNNELLASREARELRNYLPHPQATLTDPIESIDG